MTSVTRQRGYLYPMLLSGAMMIGLILGIGVLQQMALADEPTQKENMSVAEEGDIEKNALEVRTPFFQRRSCGEICVAPGASRSTSCQCPGGSFAVNCGIDLTTTAFDNPSGFYIQDMYSTTDARCFYRVVNPDVIRQCFRQRIICVSE